MVKRETEVFFVAKPTGKNIRFSLYHLGFIRI